MTFDEWIEKYKPIVNHLDPNASFQDENGEGIMFETYGEEHDFVRSKVDENVVWTYMDTDDGGTCVSAGYSFVNRIGYFITEKAWEDLDIVATVSDAECYECGGKPKECQCENCGDCTTDQSCNCGGE